MDHNMSKLHAVAWLDHSDAHILRFTRDEAQTPAHVHAQQGHQHLHNKHGPHAQHLPPTDFFNDIVKGLAGAKEILICGPGSAKNEFVKHVEKHHHLMQPLIYGVETVDHPSDEQLLKFARSFFLAADRMR